MGLTPGFSWLALTLALCLATFWSHSLAQQCEVEEEETICGLAEVIDAGTTGSGRINSSHLVQGFEACEGDITAEYRTADGTCNNIFNWGATNRPVGRLLDNAYDDEVNAPRTRDTEGGELPPATQVSRLLHNDFRLDFQNFTIMLMQWGQFIDHDIAGLPITSEVDESLECCGENGEILPYLPDRECFPIRLDANDTERFVGNCMKFARSVAARDKYGKKLVPREQVNAVTSFIDASMVYGSSQELQDLLRERHESVLGRRLRLTNVKDLLPDAAGTEQDTCTHRPQDHCFLAGDTRVNEHPGLAVIHTVFARLHNQIADDLKQARPSDTEEQLFQEARKIVGAIIQNIHYSEWLPLIIGTAGAWEHGLRTGGRTRHLPNVDPRILNEFATAAFRFGHSLIPDRFIINNVAHPLHELFNRPDLVFDDFNEVLLSLTRPSEVGGTGGAQALDRFFSAQVTDHLFETNETESGLGNGLDLVALNIQRGRDHGLPPYNEFRRLCGLSTLKSFSDIPDEFVRWRYRRLYKSVDDIDLFTGMMTEPTRFRRSRGIAGPTLACLLGAQFHALKYGDRFYFETRDRLEGFTAGQLREIRRITMAHVCCQVKGIPEVQKRLFEIPEAPGNTKVPCSSLRTNGGGGWLDFNMW